MIRSIAVTTDFSTFSRKPFGAAASIARRFDAPLYVLHVVRDAEIFTPWQVPETSLEGRCARRATVQSQLEELVANEPSFQDLVPRPRAIPGGSVSALCGFQRDEKIDLVVMASHGSTGAEHVLFGSFAAKVVQLISCPVLVYREGPVGEERNWATFEPRRLLVPLDFSRSSMVGLRVAHRWALDYGASMRLIYVVDTEDYYAHDATAEDREAYFTRVRDEGKRELEGLIEAETAGVAADAVVRMGHPAMEILKETDDYRADLVVLASRGLSNLERILLGSVGERTIHGVSCPVLLVKDPAHGA